MAGLMELLTSPEFGQFFGGIGRGLTSAGYGRGFDISGASQQFSQGMKDRRDRAAMGGLMDGMTSQQRGLMQSGVLKMETQREIMAKREFPGAFGTSKDAVFRQKIQEMVAQGIPENIASGIATGQYKLTVDPIHGGRMITDMATGAPVNYGAPSPGQAPAPAAPPSGIRPLYNQAADATGLDKSIEALSTDTLGQIPGAIGDFFSFPETIETQQNFRLATNDLVRSLSVNPRFPVAEMTRIREEIAILPSAWKSTEGLQARMKAVDKYLRSRAKFERAAAADENLPADQRRAAMQAARDMERFVGLLGVPQPDDQPVVEDVPDGVDPGLWRLMPPEDRALWLN